MLHRALVLLALLALVATGCGPSVAPSDPDLAQVERVARYLTSSRHLKRSTYMATRQSKTPGELVSFLFSDMGVAEWPPAETADAMTKQQASSVGAPLLPAAAALVHDQPNPRMHKQLVLRGDDAHGDIVADAYLEPTQAPVASEHWPMPSLE